MAVIEELKAAGLSEYEARVYYALLVYGEQTGGDVSHESKVPPTKIFSVLKRLQEKGLVQLVQQKPMMWLAIKPEIGLKTFIGRKAAFYNELEKRLLSGIKNIRQEPKKKIYEHVAIVSGYKEVFSVAAEYLRRSIKEVCISSAGESIPSQVEIESARAVKRNVDLRFITSRYTEKNKSMLSGWVKDGWVIKYLPGSEEYTFAVFDRSSCIIMVKDPKLQNERVLIAFENKDLAHSFQEYFDILWKRARIVTAEGSA
jgi:sugar-specific transcriptional regulator TrmB